MECLRCFELRRRYKDPGEMCFYCAKRIEQEIADRRARWFIFIGCTGFFLACVVVAAVSR